MKKVFIVCLVLLLLWFSLPPIQIGAVETATAEREDISVLSVTVNVNTQTNRVYTELLLQNKGTEDAEITFALPKISSGIDMGSLCVKTVGGVETAAPDGEVTLSVSAGENTGVSYTYSTKHNLAYERTIGFDLKQLKNCFNEHIGHLEWTVDMPLYEIVLVNEIQPVNYTVEDNRIRVVLEDFTINRLLERVWLSRTTHYDLLQEAVESGNLIRRLILENYRDWYLHPEIIVDNIIYEENIATGEKQINGWSTLHKVLLASDLTEEDRRYIQSKNDFDNLYYLTYPYYVPGCANAEGYRPSESAMAKISTFALYEFLLWSLRPDFSFASDYSYFEAPAFITWINHEEPVIYAEIISGFPDLNGKGVYKVVEVTDERHRNGPEPNPDDYEDEEEYWRDYDSWQQKEDEYYTLYADLYETTFDAYFTRCEFSERRNIDDEIGQVKKYEWKIPWVSHDPKLRSERIRVIVAYEEDFTNPEELKSYLDTMHVKALVRSDIALCSDRGFTVESESYPMWYGFSRSTYAYDGTEAYSFEMLKEDLAEIMSEDYSLEEREEPLKTVLSIPVLTYYRGYLYPVEEYVKEIELRNKQGEEHEILEGPTENVWLYEFNWYQVHEKLLDRLFECPVPKQIAEEREDALRRSTEDRRAMLAQVREELSLPTPEEAGVTIIPGLVIPERPTEEPTEETTETPTEVPSESDTAAAVESVPETTTKEYEAHTETPEAATEVTSAATAESESQAEAGASGGKWILPTAIAAIAVALTATTAVVAVRKKKRQ